MDSLKALLLAFADLPWMTILLIVCGVWLARALYLLNKNPDNNYNIFDLLMSKGRASLSNHVIVVFSGLTIWTVVKMVLDNKPVETLLLGALGIFVGQLAIRGWTDAMAPPNEPPKV